jgi:hypothetical protein
VQHVDKDSALQLLKIHRLEKSVEKSLLGKEPSDSRNEGTRLSGGTKYWENHDMNAISYFDALREFHRQECQG